MPQSIKHEIFITKIILISWHDIGVANHPAAASDGMYFFTN
jgi:hypothetical protein